MKPVRSRAGWAVLTALLLVLAGCGGGAPEQGEQPSTTGEPAAFDFTLTSYARTDVTTVQTAGAAGPSAPLPGQVTVTGQLLVVKEGPDGSSNTYDFQVTVDQNAFRINSSVTLNLEGGTYDFFFVLNSGGNYYAGSVLNRLLLEGSNTIPFMLNPVLGQGEVDVQKIQELATFRFQYSTAEVNSYSDPQFGLSVSGSAEHRYSINRETGLPFIYILLPPGSYTFELRFYDGSLLKIVIVETNVPIEPGGNTDVELTPIKTEVTYTYPAEVGGTAARLFFSVPGAIVREAGGLGNLIAAAAVVGAENPLFESELTLAISGENFVGGLDIPGFVPGQITWSIQFRQRGAPGGPNLLFAYCAQTVEMPAGSKTFTCEPALIPLQGVAGEPVALLNVEVTDGAAVPGTVIQANDATLGITSGLEPDGGRLESFLPANLYQLTGTHKTLDPLGSGGIVTRSAAAGIALAAGEARTQVLELQPLPEAPPEPPPPPPGAEPPDEEIDTITITARRHFRPNHYDDGDEPLKRPALVRIPDHTALEVNGDPDKFLFILYLGEVKCWYLGGQWDASEGGEWEDFFPQIFKSPACNKGYSAGDTVAVEGHLHARVVRGNPHHDVTEISVKVPVLAWDDGSYDHEDHHGYHGWHKHDGLRWHRHH